MKRKYLFFSLLLAGSSLYAQEWPAVRPEARPATRWWWLGSAVDATNLTYNLEEYAKAGLGGVEITPIYGVQGNDKNNLPFLSPQWMNMLQHTEAEGKRIGIEVDMNTGTGWPFGGPHVSMTDAATKAIFQSYQVEGGKEITLDLKVEEEKQRPVATLSRVMAYNADNKQCLNLTSKAKNGQLQWKAPAGHWNIITLYIGKNVSKEFLTTVQSLTFPYCLILRFTQFNADTDDIGQRSQPLVVFIAPQDSTVYQIYSHKTFHRIIRHQWNSH